MFEHTSRYFALETVTITLDDGRSVAYKRRRLLPRADTMATLAEVVVQPDERLDVLTGRTLGDPEQFWRICDANDAFDPDELVAEPGRIIKIALPQP